MAKLSQVSLTWLMHIASGGVPVRKGVNGKIYTPVKCMSQPSTATIDKLVSSGLVYWDGTLAKATLDGETYIASLRK